MTIINRQALSELISHEADHCVSLFMPTHKAGRECQQDPILLKNLVTRGQEQLMERGLSSNVASVHLQAAESLINDADFWRTRQDGLAVYCSDGFFRIFRLPLQVEAQVFVNNRFYVRPIMQLLHDNARFFVLALSQDHAQLFEATRYRIRDLELESILATTQQADNYRSERQSLQFRTIAKEGVGKGPAMFHGHGGTGDVDKQDILKYFKAVDRAVTNVLHDDHAPLVMACVGYLASLYEATNSYSGLIKGKVPGYPHKWHEDELRDRAWEMASPILSTHREQALGRWENLAGTDRVVSEIRDVVLAAGDGRIETLFLKTGEELWGDVDPGLRAVQPNAADETSGDELLDYSAAHTLMHGGSVYSLEPDQFPGEGVMAAVLRYA